MVCDTFGVAASTLPAALDHNRTILSVELVRTVPPSGLMQHAEMFFSCGKETPFQEWSTALRTKTCVPHAAHTGYPECWQFELEPSTGIVLANPDHRQLNPTPLRVPVPRW